ncbi:DEAD/DEAH box helicase [Roseateles koreensis]|uniref:DEAD/DEAH box helicase n=1 Tax=Roseateles koreensis TaxID=2987526 RepID=A0ABT5KRR7_9BURK|nr:DEAD/DEAH box helicase [Roseateles koreensis]MDC8785627.1 DEAD/DEAH box helicase [Roseateles koreensis]
MPDSPSFDPDRLWPPTEPALARLFERQRLQRGRSLQAQIFDLQQEPGGATARFSAGGETVFELSVQGLLDAQGRPHYNALCTCKAQRFCEHAAALLLKLRAQADLPQRNALLQDWVEALRRRAGRDELKALPRLPEADAAKLMDLLMNDGAPTTATSDPTPLPASLPDRPPARFRPRLTLRTLSRGDGLLGLAPSGRLGPRGDAVTVATVDWTYDNGQGLRWDTPAPRTLLGQRPAATVQIGSQLLQRDLIAEAEARDQLWALDLIPLDAKRLQWRDPAAAIAGAFWTLAQEEFFAAFWLEQVPRLEARGWWVLTLPGFAHRPVQAQAWTVKIERLSLSAREGSWLLSLGVEVEGESLDLAPMIADLIKRNARWLQREELAEIEDDALVVLHAPGGRRIEAPALTLKAIVGAMVDLLTDPKRAEGPIQLSDWDATRLALIDMDGRGRWQIQGDAGLRAVAHKLQAAGSPQPVAAPAGLGLTLRPYQLSGLAWLQYLREQGLAGILADDMGLGKTAQALAHLLVEKQAGRLDRPALAVLPTSLLFNWQAEARRIAPGLRVLLLQGPDRARYFKQLGDYDLVLSTYPLLWRDITPLAAQPWHVLILDEAQTVKNASSRAARSVRKLNARHRLCLTGTPLENHLGELWAQFDFLMPGFLGDSRSFQRLWRKPIEVGGESLRAQLLAQRVRPFILRRRKEEVAKELPALSTVTRRVQLYGAQRDLYESVRVAADKQVRKVLEKSGFGGALISVLDALLKLRQVCCDPMLVKGCEIAPGMERAKLELLGEMLPELLAEGRRVLVFSQFAEMLGLIETELTRLDLPYLSLTGATPVAARGEIVRRFQAQEVALMLVSLKAGGVGLNLTAADTVIHVDPWWNPAVEAQASARAHRIGQDKPVFVYKLVVAGSIEERMLDLQARKLLLAEGVLGSDAADAVKFTAQDLDLLLAPLA